MPKQLPHITIFGTRYPNPREAIFHHQLQQQLCILAVSLLLLDALGLDLRGIADPHFETQLGQQSFEPAGISSRLHPHSYVNSSQLQVSIELIGLPIAVIQSSFATFASLFHQKCDLLKARVIIYAYQHVRLLPPSLWSSTTKVYSGRGSRHCYAIKWIWPNIALRRLSGYRVNEDLQLDFCTSG